MAQLNCKQQCTFCRNYEAPTHAPTLTDRLDAAVTGIDGIRTDLNTVIRDMPEDVPMWALVDVVNALYNLRNASVVLDKAVDALEADVVEVAR